MDTHLQPINLVDLTRMAPEEWKTQLDNLYSVIVSAITEQETDTLLDELLSIESNFERITNFLNKSSSNNMEHMLYYYYGSLHSMVNLAIDVAEKQNSNYFFIEINKNYPLLLPVLESIEKRGTVTGTQLREDLGLKASNLSNFVKRINKYELIDVRRVGHFNTYSLTPKGKRAMHMYNSEKSHKTAKSLVSVHSLLSLLGNISEELTKEQPSITKIMFESELYLNYEQKKLVRQKLHNIFFSRDVYFEQRLKFAIKEKSDMVDCYIDNIQDEEFDKSYDFEILWDSAVNV